MSEALNGTSADFTDEERRHYESGGEVPLTGSSEPSRRDEVAPPPGDETPSTNDHPQGADDDPVLAEDAAEDAEGSNRTRKVGWNAYMRRKQEAEEHKRQAEQYRAEIEAIRRQQTDAAAREAVMADRLRQVDAAQQARAQAQQRAAQTPQPPPDKNADPLAYIDWQDQRIAAIEGALGRTMQGQQQVTQAQQRAFQVQQYDESVKADYRAALEEIGPRFAEPYQYVTAKMKKFLADENGLALDDPRLEPMAKEWEREITFKAKQRGKRAAQRMWELAQEFGYQPSAQGQASPQAQAASATEARIQAAGQAQQRNVSLSGVGSAGSAGAVMTPERLAALPQAEFDVWHGRYGDDGVRRVMEGR